MKKFGAKRVARKIEADDEDVGEGNDPQAPGKSHLYCSKTSLSNEHRLIFFVEPVVKRPPISKTKKSSSSRLSFGATQSRADDDGHVTPKRTGLGRLAVEHSASRLSAEHLPIRAGADSERPSYSKDYLAELRNAQRTAPKATDKDGDAQALSAPQNRALDIASKFGPSATTSLIPSAAEVAEKKERRARLAQEQTAGGGEDYISLDDTGENVHMTYSDEDEFKPRDTLIIPEKEKYAETRLIRDDEDIAEGFDEFVSDGRLELGRAGLREAERQRRAEMREIIDAAEGVDDNSIDSDDSEADRNAAYEAAQTRRGGVRKQDTDHGRPRTPPKIAPLPDLGTVIKKLKSAVEDAERIRLSKVKRLAEVRRERADINEREVWLQQQLKEAGEKFEKLNTETGKPAAITGGDTVDERPESEDEEEDDEEEEEEEEEEEKEEKETEEEETGPDDLRSALLGNGLGGAGLQNSTMRAPSPEW